MTTAAAEEVELQLQAGGVASPFGLNLFQPSRTHKDGRYGCRPECGDSFC